MIPRNPESNVFPYKLTTVFGARAEKQLEELIDSIKEKEDLQEEVERVKDNMKDKLQRAKNEMERRSDLMSRSMMTNKNMTVSSNSKENRKWEGTLIRILVFGNGDGNVIIIIWGKLCISFWSSPLTIFLLFNLCPPNDQIV